MIYTFIKANIAYNSKDEHLHKTRKLKPILDRSKKIFSFSQNRLKYKYKAK